MLNLYIYRIQCQSSIYPNIPKELFPFMIYNSTDNNFVASEFYKQNDTNYHLMLPTGKVYYINTAYINQQG